MKISHESISQFCAELGKDPLLVQGAGGNVSWKEGNTLWIKGSGTWLANATVANIFVPVDLEKITSPLSRGDFSVLPELITASNLRPSIETILHALMPQKVVVHLHAINPLVVLVQQDAKNQIEKISKRLTWKSAFIEYFKPGVEIAQAIDIAMKAQDGIHILFLKNHGVVIGGDTTGEVLLILEDILEACFKTIAIEVVNFSTKIPAVPLKAQAIYQSFQDVEVQQLAQNQSLFFRLNSDWNLYPDHAVFLGPKAFIYKNWGEFLSEHNAKLIPPDLIFIEKEGVFVTPNFNLAKTAQLRCYYDVVSRLTKDSRLCPLSDYHVASLLNWNAEKYRKKVSPPCKRIACKQPSFKSKNSRTKYR